MHASWHISVAVLGLVLAALELTALPSQPTAPQQVELLLGCGAVFVAVTAAFRAGVVLDERLTGRAVAGMGAPNPWPWLIGAVALTIATVTVNFAAASGLGLVRLPQMRPSLCTGAASLVLALALLVTGKRRRT